VNESYLARIMPPDQFAQLKQDRVSGGGGEMSYVISNRRVEWIRAPRGVDVGAWRGIAAGYTKFAIETLIDEIAALKGMNPVAYRIAMLKDDPRAATVVKTVADMANWGQMRQGRAVGIAFSDALRSRTAAAAEVSVDEASGEIKVHHLWAAVDACLAVQPRNIVAQIESAMTFGLGAALIEQITVRNGVVQQTNFHEYRVMRMSDMPLMDVKVISTDNKPTGIGEAGVPVVAPAIANAVAVLTGKRLRHLPMTPDRVKRGSRDPGLSRGRQGSGPETTRVSGRICRSRNRRQLSVAAPRVWGGRRDGPMPLDALRRVIEVNLIGSFNIMRLSAAEMSNLEPLDEGERGIIVSTASAAAYEGQIGTGRLQRLKVWHRLPDLAGRARARALQNPRAGDRSGHIRDADAAGPAAEHPRQPRSKCSVLEPARQGGGICGPGAAPVPQRDDQRRGGPP
jgi:NAD(P)-dependent dehydrogenase (short-subunit alcohol dehydrogenase family)